MVRPLLAVESEVAITGIDAVRANARIVARGWPAFWRHFTALLYKRAAISKRDYKGICYQLLIPVVVTAAGLALLKSTQTTGFADYELSTAQFNAPSASIGFGRRRITPLPAYPNVVPMLSFKSFAQMPAASSGGAWALADFSANFLSGNTTFTAETTLSPAAAIALDYAAWPRGIINASAPVPEPDYARLSAGLLQMRSVSAASKYLAYAFPRAGTLARNASLSIDGFSSQSGGLGIPLAVFHNTTARHSAPLGLNLATSALLRIISGAPSASISARNHPLPYTLSQQTSATAFFSFSSAIIIMLAFSFFPAYQAIFVVKEREVTAKHQQIISGVSIPAYWAAMFAFDIVSFLPPAGLAIAITKAFALENFVSLEKSRLGAFIALFFFYGTSVSGFTYVCSFLFTSHSTAQNIILFVNISAMILVIALLIMSQIDSMCRVDEALRWIFRFIPGYSLGNGLVSLSFLTLLPVIDATCDISQGVVRPLSAYAPYDAFDRKAAGTNIVYMACLTPVYFFLAILIDYGFSNPAFRMWLQPDRLAAAAGAPIARRREADDDADVVAEAERVAAKVKDGDDVVTLSSLHKQWGTKTAVQGLSFGITAGEVFGFLGINGAGKTTTLQMLSGDVLPTSGTARLGGYDILTEQSSVRRLLGYCPQWDALLELLTVREHLALYARIKGIPEASLPAVVEEQIAAFDLVSFANKTGGSLSGGNKRKLSVAIALMASPPIVFLDEPSTGMDPVAKRFMWRVIARVAAQRSTCIILTTHSMEEVEALCGRIGIMVGGRLRCFGSAQRLRDVHGSGFVFEAKLQPPSVEAVQAAWAQLEGVGAAASICRVSFPKLAAALNMPAREAYISEAGTAWALHSAWNASPTKTLPLDQLATWWASEDDVDAFMAAVAVALPGAALVERQGMQLRFSVPPTESGGVGKRLSEAFARIEALRAGHALASMSLSQTSLEQIFNLLAGSQDEERNVARGLITHKLLAPAADSAAVSVTDQGSIN